MATQTRSALEKAIGTEAQAYADALKYAIQQEQEQAERERQAKEDEENRRRWEIENARAEREASREQDKYNKESDALTSATWESIISSPSIKTEYDVWKYIDMNQDALRNKGVDVDKLWAWHKNMVESRGVTGELPKDQMGASTTPNSEVSNKLRSEFMANPNIKDFVNVQTQYNKVQASSDTAAGDLSLIFAYMKMLDPGSVVREGEFATAQNTAGVPDQIRNLYNKVVSGERLAPQQRNNFKNEAAKVLNAQMQTARTATDFYREQAIKQGANPDDVVGAIGSTQEVPVSQFAPEQSWKDKFSLGNVGNLLQTFTESKMRVRVKSTGQTGTIPSNEWNPEVYERI